jgi:integrase
MGQIIRIMSDAEFDTVMSRAARLEGETGCAGRNAAGVMLGLHGLRCGEVCGLKAEDLDTGQGLLFVATLKKGRKRIVEIEARFALWLARLAKGVAPAAPLLRTCRGRQLDTSHFRRAWHRLSMRYLGRVVKFHSLRHTAAQRLFDATKDLLAVQKFLGHKSLASTQVYLSSGVSLRDHMPRMPENKEFQPLLFEAG